MYVGNIVGSCEVSQPIKGEVVSGLSLGLGKSQSRKLILVGHIKLLDCPHLISCKKPMKINFMVMGHNFETQVHKWFPFSCCRNTLFLE